MSEDIPFHSIVIVGAGISGLTAARALRTRFPDLVVLEANHTRGGRISEVRTILDDPQETGPSSSKLLCMGAYLSARSRNSRQPYYTPFIV